MNDGRDNGVFKGVNGFIAGDAIVGVELEGPLLSKAIKGTTGIRGVVSAFKDVVDNAARAVLLGGFDGYFSHLI